MSTKRVDLRRRTFFVLSGASNALGKPLAVEMCRRFRPGSVAVLFESSEEDLQEVKKEIQNLENGIAILCCPIESWLSMSAATFRELLTAVLSKYPPEYFELAFIMHNEGQGATERLMEPDSAALWKQYVQESLYAAVALNQEFLQATHLVDVEKLVVNITSSLLVRPFYYSGLMGSCKRARDMYFRAMAAEEGRNGVAVISYSPGIFESHKPERDLNNNLVDLLDLEVDPKLLEQPRTQPLRSTLKLINILEEMSFISGHDVDYYDTFNL